MAKFVYRMQNILDLKIKMEEQRKAEYGLANARLRKEEDKLRELIIKKQDMRNRQGNWYREPLMYIRFIPVSMRSMQ